MSFMMLSRLQSYPWAFVTPAQANRAIALVNLAGYEKRFPHELSGGQQQRVFLARSLAQEAEIFCFDEPFVGVDRKTETIIFQIFHELADAGKIVN